MRILTNKQGIGEQKRYTYVGFGERSEAFLALLIQAGDAVMLPAGRVERTGHL